MQHENPNHPLLLKYPRKNVEQAVRANPFLKPELRSSQQHMPSIATSYPITPAPQREPLLSRESNKVGDASYPINVHTTEPQHHAHKDSFEIRRQIILQKAAEEQQQERSGK